jgi:AcrR family transcriptional regulator
VRTAVAIADAEGLPAVSMRRVAAELGAATMSLYRHLPGKDDLVLHMADLVFAEATLPDPQPAHWRDRLELVAREQWALYRRHPWLARLISLTRPMLVPNGMAHTEWTIRALDGLGLPPAVMFHLAVTLAGLVAGTAVHLDSEVEAEQNTGMTSEEWMAAQDPEFEAIAAPDRFPMLFEIGSQPDFELDLDTVVELGLKLMLDGLAARLATDARG